MKRIIYPGTFDPIHYGHIDIARRASRLFDEVYICVSDNQHKNPLFSHEERVEMIEECTSDLDNVSAYSNPNNLVVKFAQEKEAIAIIRGLRQLSDFELEFQTKNSSKLPRRLDFRAGNRGVDDRWARVSNGKC